MLVRDECELVLSTELHKFFVVGKRDTTSLAGLPVPRNNDAPAQMQAQSWTGTGACWASPASNRLIVWWEI